MYRGQKSIRNGIEDFLCPFENFYLTCGPNESNYHMGIMAIDVRGSEAGLREPYYAPADVKCIRVYPESGQAMWQTINNVRCSNGYVGKVTFMTVHDDSFNAYVGMVIPQGEQLGNMGTKGNATGVHCHIQCGLTDDTSWYPNDYENYMFNNEVDPEDVFFMDNTNIINGIGNWKYLNDVPVHEPAETPNEDPIETPFNDLEKGSYVKIIGYGNASSYGDSNRAVPGYEGTITDIYEGRPFPYEVSDHEGVLGYYPAESLSK